MTRQLSAAEINEILRGQVRNWLLAAKSRLLLIMAMNPEDIEKAEHLWKSMNEATGEEKPFPSEQITSAFSILAEQMAQENPDQLIYCNCHGDLWSSRDVDMWGLCPYGRGE